MEFRREEPPFKWLIFKRRSLSRQSSGPVMVVVNTFSREPSQTPGQTLTDATRINSFSVNVKKTTLAVHLEKRPARCGEQSLSLCLFLRETRSRPSISVSVVFFCVA